MNKLLYYPADLNSSTSHTLYVRYMVGPTCKQKVVLELDNLKLPYFLSVGGIITFYEKLAPGSIEILRSNLKKHGLSILDDDSSRMMDSIITLINKLVHDSEQLPSLNYEQVLSVIQDITNEGIIELFTEITGYTFQQFIVLHKIERAKALVLYDNFTDEQISELLLYKSEALMQAQFLKITGLNTSYFRSLKSMREMIAATA
ncbi:MAG: AraC family transcriptional regulator [Balneolia bacterium]|nr:AraC family transcriptional regulator [Balneolia bacterium]